MRKKIIVLATIGLGACSPQDQLWLSENDGGVLSDAGISVKLDAGEGGTY